MAVRVRDLHDQILDGDDGTLLLCQKCWSECSANSGDYFCYPLDHIFTCCKRQMILVRKMEVYQKV